MTVLKAKKRVVVKGTTINLRFVAKNPEDKYGLIQVRSSKRYVTVGRWIIKNGQVIIENEKGEKANPSQVDLAQFLNLDKVV